MKVSFVLTAFLFLTFHISAQEWETDLAVAQEKAMTQNQNIILVFQGSDWCAPCKKLDKEIWSTETFQNANKDHFVMLQADFPRRKKNRLSKEQRDKNSQLAEKYNQEGIFPLVVVLDSKGNVLGKTGYRKDTPEEYFSHLVSFEKLKTGLK